MSLLGALVSPALRSSFGAAPSGLLVVEGNTLNPNTTPPAFYALIKNGGFAVWDEPTVQSLAQRYFSVASHDVTPSEAAWLEANASGWVARGRPKLVWFAVCPTGASVDASGQPVCGRAMPPGVKEIPPRPGTNPCSPASIPESAEGILRPGDLEQAERLKPPGSTVCFRYFGGNPEVSDAQMDSARETIRVFDRLLRSVEAVERNRQQYGGDFTVGQKNALSAARSWLATNVQPVEKARPYLFTGSGNIRRPRIARTRFGVIDPITATVVIVAFIALAFITWRASAAYLADTEVRKMGLQHLADVSAQMQPRIDELIACVKDTSRTQAQRQSCNEALKSLSDLTGNLTPDMGGGGGQDWGAVAKWGTIGLGVVASVYLLGPAIRGASKATGESFAVSEQKSRVRRKLLSDIAG